MASSPLPDRHGFDLIRERGWGVVPRPAWLLLGWLLCCAILLWLLRGNLSPLAFRDPDDAMRLQQVRDWVAGQPFLDVSQHRVNPPLGGPMHWSRIVDMPIAAIILLLRPIVGSSLAEIVACSTVPLVLLGSLSWALFVATRQITGEAVALLAAVLLLTTPTILTQFEPLRIDHHGWQVLMATIALGGAVTRRRATGGVIAGCALAIWLQISSEALPYTALFGAIFALRQWREPQETDRFLAFAMTLGGLALPLLIVLRGAAMVRQVYCDSFSAAYVWPLAAFAIATPIASRLVGSATATRRLFVAALGGGAAVAVFLLVGRPCLTGDPFAALGPVAYKLWYLKVMEGRPIWEQARSMQGLILLPPIAGILGSLVAAHVQKDARERWIVLSILLLGSSLVAVLVMRAVSVAHVFALPGLSWMMLQLFQRAQRQTIAVLRVAASSSVALLTPAVLCAIWIVATAAPGKDNSEPSDPGNSCRTAAALAPLRLLPTSTLFAPLDVGPDILIRTSHKVVGTAHHRNAKGITAVVEGFTAPPEQARAIISSLNGGSGPDYLVTCHALNEFQNYAQDHRGSLAAVLDRGRPPAWLKQVTLPGSKSLRVYKVMPLQR